MLQRVRRLRISLAAKCQILFGAAVVAIIAAALSIPWQRMEQLTGQLNDRAASSLADALLAQHTADPDTTEIGEPLSAFTTTRPVTTLEARAVFARLIEASADPQSLPPFERRAMSQFARESDELEMTRLYDRRDDTRGFRYARALYATASCLECHATDGPPSRLPLSRLQSLAAPNTTPATLPTTTIADTPLTVSTTQPTTPSRARLLGLVSVDIPSQISTNQLLLNRVFMLAAGLIAGTLAIVVFYVITTRLILQPVRVLQETAEKVSQGDLNIRSDISTGDEFQQLAETFNTMLSNLKQNADSLRAMNKSLDVKLGQLAESNVALFESNRLKSEFLANVSHELRTPLNSILGFAELLKDAASNSGDGKSTRYVQNILQAGRNLLELINDLLDLAKIEAGRMEIRSEPISLSDLFEGLSNVLKPLIEQKKLSLVVSVDSDVPIVQTDPGKLQQVLYNFLSNAIKFSATGQRIELTASVDAGQTVTIRVRDFGPGIEPGQHAVIFEKFRQIDGSVTRQHSGTGLGLAISKELTNLLSGSIGVDSTPGQGATFWIHIPLKITAESQDVRKRMLA